MVQYTAEEYRNVLKLIYDMDAEERKNVFGISMLVGGYVKDFSVSELIEKYRAYVNTPKTGEYWKNNGDGEMVVVRYADKDTVRGYYCDDGGCNISFSYKYFVGNFAKTEYKSKYLEDFLNEMKEVSK